MSASNDTFATSILDDEAGVRTQFALWGYALTGDMLERGALISEQGDQPWFSPPLWDWTKDYLSSIQRYIDGEEAPPPEWWALWWVGKQKWSADVA